MSNHIPNNILAAGLLLTSTVFLAEFAVAEPTPYTQNSKLFPRKAGWFKLDSTIPAHMEDAAPTDTSIYIFFTTAVATDTNADTFQLKRMDTGKVVATDNGIHGATVILTPEQKLEYGTEYYVENNGVVRSSLGKRLKDRVFVRFSTDNIFIPIADPTYSPADGEGIAPSGEIYRPVTEERAALHAAHHHYTPLVTATLPPLFDPPAMDSPDDYVVQRDEMVSINPAPNEYLAIMEGQRHGFENLTVVMTHTIPGNGAPLHTHTGEEAHVLTEGTMYYRLGDEEMVVEAPYILNIPAMVPHGFINVGKEAAKLVGIFPESNHWEYDVLDFDIFADYYQSQSSTETTEDITTQLRDWHSGNNQ